MTEIEIAKSLSTNFGDSTKLNEAETRLQIIDTILFDVLKWPKTVTSVEKVIEGNRADYVLYNHDRTPQLIIESKREGVYFELPVNFNHEKLYQKITLEKLLTCAEIKSSILQVKEYAEDLACNYAAICNGHVWIIFKLFTTNKPWKKLPAFVVKKIAFFHEEYTQAVNLLGYTSVTDLKSIKLNIGVTKKTYPEIFYPKNSIRTFNTPVNSNKYAGILETISRKYLGPIPISDKTFMKRCYVTNKGHYDDLQKNIGGLIHDSLTPYFKNLGFRDFSDDSIGGAFGLKIIETIKRENLDNVMVLFGGRGSGKSTFIKRFLFHIRPIEIDMYSIVALIDLIDSSQTKDELTKEIWNKVLNGIDKANHKSSSQDSIIELFKDEYDIFCKQILNGLKPEDQAYVEYRRRWINDILSDTKTFCEKLSIYWKNQRKGFIIFLDNMDQLPQDLQDTSFLTAIEIAKKLSCLVIISMREERFYNAKSKGVLDAYHTPGFHLTSPVIPEVIFKRLVYILKTIEKTEDKDYEFNIKSEHECLTIVSFFQICLRQIRDVDSPLSQFLRFATHGDVRQALEFFKGFLTSGYTNINEMAPIPSWVFQIHQVIKPMMIPDRFFYDEKLSKIPNIYQLRNETNSSHFSGLRLLNALHKRSAEKTASGFIDARYLLQTLENKYGFIDDFTGHLATYLRLGLIEASNRIEEFSEQIDQIKITAFGDYILDFLGFNFAYLDLVCLDCGLFDETLNNTFVDYANQELDFYYSRNFMDRIKLRIERVEKFIDYLIKQEEEEFADLGLGASEIKYSEKLKTLFENEKRIIFKSAKKKERLEAEYN